MVAPSNNQATTMDSSDWHSAFLQQSHWSSLTVVLLMILESAPITGLFLPGIFMVIGMGALTATGQLTFADTLLFGSLGAIIGDSLGFWLGRRVGADYARSLIHRRLHSRYHRAERYLQRFGAPGLFIGRFLWFVHPLVPPLAGAAGIRARWFYAIDIPACVLWMTLYLTLGHTVTGAWLDRSLMWLEGLSVMLLALALAALAFWLHRRHG